MKTFACWCAILMSALGLAQAQRDAPAAPAADPAPSRFHLGAGVFYWDFSRLKGMDLGGAGGGGIVGHFHLHDFYSLELRLSGFATSDTRNVETEDGRHLKNDVTLVAMPLEANILLRLPLGKKLCLYGGPGVGYYLFDGQSNSDLETEKIVYDIEVDDEGGWYVLAGLRAKVSANFDLFIEGKYTWIKTSIEKAVDVRHKIGIDWVAQELDFSGLAVGVGMIFSF